MGRVIEETPKHYIAQVISWADSRWKHLEGRDFLVNKEYAQSVNPAYLEKQYAFFIPDEDFVKSLKLGDYAPNSMGAWSKVVEITAQKDDIHGVPFICYYVEFGSNGGSISSSMKAGELMRTVRLSRYYKSLELDDIEQEMKRRGIRAMALQEYKDKYNEGWHRPVEEFKYF